MPANEVARKGATIKMAGAPVGNANGLRHGLRSSGSVIDVRIGLGSMPAKLKRVERAVNSFRRMIEAAAVAAHGNIGVYHAALIQSACRHETHALLASRWLRLEMDKLDPAQRLAVSKAVADVSTARDRCLERLGLADASADALADLYAPLPDEVPPALPDATGEAAQ